MVGEGCELSRLNSAELFYFSLFAAPQIRPCGHLRFSSVLISVLEMSGALRTFPRGAAKALCTVSTPSKGIYLLSMHNQTEHGLDNRLTPDFIKEALLPALDHVELTFRRDWENGGKEAALVFTGERVKGKFFSNGLDLELLKTTPDFFKNYYYTLMSRIFSFPMATVSAINGHNFAGGFVLSQCADIRIIRAERAWSCMNELLFGASLPHGVVCVLEQRLPPQTISRLLLTAHRYTAAEALEARIVDEIVPGDSEATIARALEIAASRKGDSTSGVLQEIKRRVYRHALEGLQTDEKLGNAEGQNAARIKQMLEAASSAKL